MEVLLSICIPSFRGPSLRRLLSSVARQEQSLPYELIVQDNCSPTGVSEVFNEIKSGHDFPWICRKNSSNIGGYRNVWKCSTDVRGKFLIMVSDDDEFRDDAFSQIARAIELLDTCNGNLAMAWDAFKFRGAQDMKITEYSFEWLRHVPINLPAFISASIWRTSYWQKTNYFGLPGHFSLPQLHRVLDACTLGPIVLSRRAFVKVGADEETGRASYWFYNKNQVLPLLEYPYLYGVIQRSGKVDYITLLMLRLRRMVMRVRSIEKLLYVSAYNETFGITPSLLRQCGGGGVGALLFYYLSMFILNSRSGIKFARGYAANVPPPARNVNYQDGRRF